MATWLCVGVIEIVASHGAWLTAMASGTWVAFFVVSTISWAVTIPQSRLTGAVEWLLLIAIPPFAPFVSPMPLLGLPLMRSDARRVLPFLAVAIMAAGVAFARIVRSDVPLEAAQ